ncbi:PD-(D/E)XK motif protein [Nocardia sp. BMG111209]|uniref:PD-(D/E)XK motif protein n=1 Tax=Nocardia sp. BMG111209 TaxID=1160137 RepID=UPI000475796D|nr:PD-(D/E)XK motif protein [Nocardia sp. BMG111209]
MSSGLRAIIEDHWSILESSPSASDTTIRVSDLPVETTNGNVAAAVDSSGLRHILVPVDSRQTIRRGLNGPILQLSRRPLQTSESYRVYADLTCFHRDFNDVFTTLCGDILAATEETAQQPVKGLYRVLDHWRALFQNTTSLRPQQLAGLYAELLVLERLLDINPSSHSVWRGPTGHHHDFSSGRVAVEVKESIAFGDKGIRVHGLDQLDAPEGGLLLAWFRLAPDLSGPSLQDLIDRALESSDDESAVLAALVLAGYRASDIDHYRDVKFRTAEERWYRVDSNFPRLTSTMLSSAQVPVQVHDVHYTVDLSVEPPYPLNDDEVGAHLRAMVQESA